MARWIADFHQSAPAARAESLGASCVRVRSSSNEVWTLFNHVEGSRWGGLAGWGCPILQNGVILGGGPYTYFTGSYSSEGASSRLSLFSISTRLRHPITCSITRRTSDRDNGHLQGRPGRADGHCARREKIDWSSRYPTAARAAWRRIATPSPVVF